MAVLHGIDVHLVDVMMQVRFIADQVLPVAALPDATLTAGNALRRAALADRQCPAEGGFDLCPAVGVVGVAVRQPPHAMQMVGQHRDGQHVEQSCRPRRAECVTQQVGMIDQQAATALQQVHGEEVGAARHP